MIVGAGPAGLAAAIKLKQLSADLSVCIVEKGAEVGAHILSGNVMEMRALNEVSNYSTNLPIGRARIGWRLISASLLIAADVLRS